MKFNKQDFEKRLNDYALKIVKLSDFLPNDRASDIIIKQLIRSGMSVSANVFEAKAASSKKDYINFYLYALKSANESKFWIGLLVESKKIDAKLGSDILQETKEIANILGASVVTMKKNK